MFNWFSKNNEEKIEDHSDFNKDWLFPYLAMAIDYNKIELLKQLTNGQRSWIKNNLDNLDNFIIIPRQNNSAPNLFIGDVYKVGTQDCNLFIEFGMKWNYKQSCGFKTLLIDDQMNAEQAPEEKK